MIASFNLGVLFRENPYKYNNVIPRLMHPLSGTAGILFPGAGFLCRSAGKRNKPQRRNPIIPQQLFIRIPEFFP